MSSTAASAQQLFEIALRHHQAGRLADAEVLYRQVLTAQSDHVDAHNNLAVALAMQGRTDEAITAFGLTLQLRPDFAAAHFNLGNALKERGRLNEAMAAYRDAIQLQPDYVAAHINLGATLADQRRFDEAIAGYRHALQIDPNCLEAHTNLGHALKEMGRLEEAVAAYHCALELKPDYAQVHSNLGSVLREQGRLEEAIAAHRRALQLKPDFAEGYNDLGLALLEQGQLDAAAEASQQALRLKPDLAQAYNNLGIVLWKRGQLEEAVQASLQALLLRPNSAEAYNNLSNALRDQGQLNEAMAVCRRALELKPDLAEAHQNLGNMLKDRGQLDEALQSYRDALRFKSDYADAYNNLGIALKDGGQLDEAVGALRRAVQLKPHDPGAHSNLIYTLHFLSGQDTLTVDEEQQQWNQRFCAPLKRFILPHANDRSPERRLRVGYVSSDFREHVVGRNLIPLFQCHDHGNVEIVCYSGVSRPDHLTAVFRQGTDRWRDTVRMSDEALAGMIRQDDVDILVDLTQHMAGNRLLMFARQPAPVQVSFAGYPESAGVEVIKYRISDRWLESEMGDRRSEIGWKPEPDLRSPNCDLRTATQEQVFLLDSFWCYDPCGKEVEVNRLPAMESGWVTFGSLNNFCKINEAVLRLWARVLAQVESSRLVLMSGVGSHRHRTVAFLEREGIASHRVEFVEPRGRKEYLELYHRLDMVLDTFPYNGHTTSLDALWMGVPVVSLAGKRAVSRAGLSQLSNLGLRELVAFSEDEYVEIATRLARDLPRLSDLRRTLRARMEASVLMDATRFARGIERAYRAMWQQHLENA